MRRDDHGIDHEMVERFRQAGRDAAAAGLIKAMAIVVAARDQKTVEGNDGREGDDDSGN